MEKPEMPEGSALQDIPYLRAYGKGTGRGSGERGFSLFSFCVYSVNRAHTF